MSVTVGHTTFDRVRYDAEAVVLYLHAGDPSQPSISTSRPKATRFAMTLTDQSLAAALTSATHCGHHACRGLR